ncbi:hypothetical protein HG530_006714 [Fusarium avenaceum]|nr:hypothetical protein HG530_006714 [Fusarium avenaceum]
MSSSQALPVTKMVNINLTSVPGESFGETIGGELGVIPGVTTDVVSPLVTIRVVGMHEVAEVEEAVPSTVFNFVLVELGKEVDIILKLLRSSSGTISGSPVSADGLGLSDIFTLSDKHRRVVDLSDMAGECILRRSLVKGNQVQLAGTGDSVRGVKARLPIFVGNLQCVQVVSVVLLTKAVMVRSKVEWFCRWTVQPKGDTSDVGRGRRNVKTSRESLPEVTEAYSKTSNGCTTELLTVELISSDIRTRISPKTSDALDGFTEETTVNARDSNMAVVKLFTLEWDVEAKTNTSNEVLLSISIKDQAMNNLDRLRTGVEVESNHEGQPGAMTRVVCCRMLSPHSD